MRDLRAIANLKVYGVSIVLLLMGGPGMCGSWMKQQREDVRNRLKVIGYFGACRVDETFLSCVKVCFYGLFAFGRALASGWRRLLRYFPVDG